MSAKSGGSFAALLMSGPLAAIPLMALFGVPQFSSVSASTDEEHDGVLRRPPAVASQPSLTSDVTEPTATPTTPEPQVFGQTPASTVTPSPSPRPIHLSGASHTQPSSERSGSFVTEAAPQSAFVEAPSSPPITDDFTRESTTPRARPTLTTLTTTTAPASHSQTWENAAQKLQELGIDDYRLERGQDEHTYLFICQFAPGADPRIIRRFEAEASEPTVAVQKVLQRITDWQATSSTH